MPPKSKTSNGKSANKTRKASKSPTKGRPKSNNSHKAAKKKGSGKKNSARTPTRPVVPDPFCKAAMENALMISHNAEMFLTFRGFAYSGTKCKGGGKKGKGKKKKK